jgi:hypothetical protein
VRSDNLDNRGQRLCGDDDQPANTLGINKKMKTMKTINFNIKIKDLAGKPIENFNTKEQVANALVTGQSSSPIRTVEIARKVFKDGRVDLTNEDQLLLKNILTGTSRFTDLVKAQVLELFEK